MPVLSPTTTKKMRSSGTCSTPSFLRLRSWIPSPSCTRRSRKTRASSSRAPTRPSSTLTLAPSPSSPPPPPLWVVCARDSALRRARLGASLVWSRHTPRALAQVHFPLSSATPLVSTSSTWVTSTARPQEGHAGVAGLTSRWSSMLHASTDTTPSTSPSSTCSPALRSSRLASATACMARSSLPPACPPDLKIWVLSMWSTSPCLAGTRTSRSARPSPSCQQQRAHT
mmetsp:Transcript_13782/g.36961  ORF Transcript_13782/g.36961 Transcript_13782/m.36961 type:complete len:227 (-) Transcript_13782:332-1012(-)